MKKKKLWLATVLMSLALTVTSTFPALAASGADTVDFNTTDTAVSGTGNTTAEKTTPTCDPLLARRVLVAMGVVSSSRTTTTGLKKQVTRQQFAKMLVQLSPYKNKVGTTVKTSMYSDVKKTSAYAPYIKIAVKNGWMKGDLKGRFRPK